MDCCQTNSLSAKYEHTQNHSNLFECEEKWFLTHSIWCEMVANLIIFGCSIHWSEYNINFQRRSLVECCRVMYLWVVSNASLWKQVCACLEAAERPQWPRVHSLGRPRSRGCMQSLVGDSGQSLSARLAFNGLPFVLQCCTQEMSTVAVCGTELWVVYWHKGEEVGLAMYASSLERAPPKRCPGLPTKA